MDWTDPSSVDTHDVTWSWGDGSTDDTRPLAISPASQGHTYTDLGSYPVAVTVTDKDGGTNSDTVVIDVVDVTPPSVTAALVPLGDDDLYRVEFTCVDDIDPDPDVNAFLKVPGKKRIRFDGCDD